MKRIRVPEEMFLHVCRSFGVNPETTNLREEILQPALEWLSNNPQVPTDEQIGDMLRDLRRSVSGWDETSTYYRSRDLCVEWQRRCFVQEEPEMPAELKDLTFISEFVIEDESLYRNVKEKLEKVAAEAYRRGLSAGLGLEVDAQGKQK